MLNATQGFTYNKFEKPNDWPKIDKTFDYKIENGKLLSGNEHIYLSGPVTYTKVGNPTILDGIASGFSDSNHLTTSSTIGGLTPNTIEVNTKITIGNTVDEGAGLVGTHSAHCYGIQMRASGKIRACIYDANAGSYNAVDGPNATANTTYLLNFLYTKTSSGSTVQLKVSSDNGTTWQTYSHEGTEIAVVPSGESAYQIGYSRYGAFTGAIDLKETYIKVNGKLWFYGKNYTTSNMVPVPAELEYNNTTTPSNGWVNTDTSSSNFQQFTPAPKGTMIGKDDTHNLVVETPIVNGELLSPKLVGPVSYTVVGNPTIVDGVMTYSNVSNYIRTRQNFLRSYNDYEIVCKCAKRLSTEEIVYCMSTGNNGNLQARLLSNAFRFIPYTFSDYIQISGTFATNVWYWFKVRRTGNTIYTSYSTDGVSWSNEVSKTFTQLTTASNWIAFGTRVVSDSDWKGTSIDLNETYIKVNGKLWFGKEDWTPSTYIDNAIYLLGSHSTDYSTYNTQGINPTIETESDESGTYNVWIDNQEIYKEQSNPLDINWSNLALTTGYDITTPSTLKAHVIKVEPNNGNITRFSTTIEEDSDESI